MYSSSSERLLWCNALFRLLNLNTFTKAWACHSNTAKTQTIIIFLMHLDYEILSSQDLSYLSRWSPLNLEMLCLGRNMTVTEAPSWHPVLRPSSLVFSLWPPADSDTDWASLSASDQPRAVAVPASASARCHARPYTALSRLNVTRLMLARGDNEDWGWGQ